jgi:hypothetical protein
MCVDLETDPENCGGCGQACAMPSATPACSNGVCTLIVCDPGFANCNGVRADGCEVNLSNDPRNCGSCGRTCSTPNGMATCVNGTCGGCGCNAGFADCDHNCANGCEVNLETDANNCGACGNVCNLPNATAACVNGVCAIAACSPGYQDCDAKAADGCEVDVSTDPNACGSCGRVCFVPHGVPTCVAGVCDCPPVCLPGYANCSGDCSSGCDTHTDTDLANCGACGNACPGANAFCFGGVCGCFCGQGYANCDNDCGNGCEVHVTTDPNNCGGCGHVCAANQSCVNGFCQ